MLARTLGPKFNLWPVYIQPKLNGIRVLAQKGIFQSRGEKLWKSHFFPHIADELASAGLSELILDGEFYVHGWRLQRINSAVGVNNNEPNPDTPNIVLHVFDTVDPTKAFGDRWIGLRNRIVAAELPHVSAVPTAYVNNREEFLRYFHMAVAEGYEGVMARLNQPYEFGQTLHGTQLRSRSIWKYKSWSDDEFVCVGITSGEGKASIGIGALVLQKKLLILGTDPTFKVGTGFDDTERISLAANPPIGKLVRVRYLELTADGTPFNPSFLAVMQ